MSEKKKSYGQRVEEAVGKGVPAPEIMQMMVVDYLKELANGKPLVTISDGDTTIQCVVNNPGREWPKQTAEASGCRCKACGWTGKWGDACAVPNDYVCPNCSSYLIPAP